MTPTGATARSGQIRVGDVIIAVDGRPVAEHNVSSGGALGSCRLERVIWLTSECGRRSWRR
eukprot:1243520-Rhodomonas_salina.1